METYKSKLGFWLVGPVGAVMLTVLYIMVHHKIWAGTGIVSALLIFILHMFFTTYYQIVGKKLIIKCGFLYHLTVDIDAIKIIKETNNPISSPATSLDRLEIRYQIGSVLVSPQKKKDFIDRLIALNPNIEIHLKHKKP